MKQLITMTDNKLNAEVFNYYFHYFSDMLTMKLGYPWHRSESQRSSMEVVVEGTLRGLE